MDDLIYRGTAIIAVKCGSLSARTVYGRTDEGMTVLKETLTAIKELPAVDAVEVVRCKDCVYYNVPNGMTDWCDAWGNIVREDDFCSFAERRVKDD